jgi:hypothetical protein
MMKHGDEFHDPTVAVAVSEVQRFGRLDIYVASAGINDLAETHLLEIAFE